MHLHVTHLTIAVKIFMDWELVACMKKNTGVLMDHFHLKHADQKMR